MNASENPIALPWGDPRTGQFVTNVGMITSDGPIGPNVMAAEWTHHVAHCPGLIAISIGASKATAANIRASREFGVNLISCEQAAFARIAGSCTAREVDKMAALRALGLPLYPGRRIQASMIGGAALNAECRLHREVPLGAGYILFVGEVLEAHASDSPPLAYHKGRFWRLEPVEDASMALDGAREVLDRHRRPTAPLDCQRSAG